MAGVRGTSLEERFWAKVHRGSPEECWSWTAGCYSGGYGKFKLTSGQLEMERTEGRGAHQVAFRLANGYWGKVTCHTCDNPTCCNPAHLRDGTQTDNMEDMTRKGRRSSGVAQASRGVPLTRKQAIVIRSSFTGERGDKARLAREYGVARYTINRVLRGTHHALLQG